MGLRVVCGRAYQEGKEPDNTGPWWATSNGVGVRLKPELGPVKVVDWLRFHFPEALIVYVTEDDGTEYKWKQTGIDKSSTSAVEFLDQVLKYELGRTRTESIEQGICIQCGRKAEFEPDQMELDEYERSGLCALCQPGVFA